MFYMKTDKGLKRDNNEDYICQKYLDPNNSIYIVLDGIGGTLSGEVASSITAEKILEYIDNNALSSNDSKSIEIYLEDAVKYANKSVYDLNKTNSEYKGMGTTLSLMYQKEDSIYYLNIGDTRIYEILEDRINQITEDDTYVNALVKDNIITKNEASKHPDRHILVKAIGISKGVQFNVNVIENAKGKKFLICTDGLTNMLSDDEIFNIILTNKPSEICDSLINSANQAGGNDNISVMYIEV